MSLEELTKSQIVLLTLFVSFVTSIATGIVTVALLGQAPATITQSVNHIIRETVQSVVPKAISQPAAVAQPDTIEVPVSEPPDLPRAIASAERSVARLYSSDADSAVFLGLGVVLAGDGTMVTDADAMGRSKTASAVLPSGSSTRMSVFFQDSGSGLLYLKPISTSTNRHFVPATLSVEPQEVGEEVVAIAGKSTLRIASGLVVAVGDATSQKVIFTDFPDYSIIKGTPIINAIGEFVGMSTGAGRSHESTAFMPIIRPPAEDTKPSGLP